jgi:hypothetical protein
MEVTSMSSAGRSIGSVGSAAGVAVAASSAGMTIGADCGDEPASCALAGADIQRPAIVARSAANLIRSSLPCLPLHVKAA